MQTRQMLLAIISVSTTDYILFIHMLYFLIKTLGVTAVEVDDLSRESVDVFSIEQFGSITLNSSIFTNMNTTGMLSEMTMVHTQKHSVT